MNVFGIGLPEMAVIGAVALLVFGPKRLPELGRTLGKTLKGFQSASKEFEREINKAMLSLRCFLRLQSPRRTPLRRKTPALTDRDQLRRPPIGGRSWQSG